jgi:prepilin-type N-terminal cleavage/methylation domain-containing protein
MSRCSKIKNGFSLIEVVTAIAIIALISGGAMEILRQGFVAARKTQQEAAAYNLARELMERFSDWNTLDQLDSSGCSANTTVVNTLAGNPYSPTNQPLCALNPFNTITLNNIVYTPQLAISDGPIFPEQLKRLEITISWTEGSMTRTFRINTLKANY